MQLDCLEKIDIKHKEAIESIRLKYGVDTNAMSFYSCYIWQNYFKHKLYLTEDMYAVTYNLCGENAWYFPVGSDVKKKEFIEKCLQYKELSFHKLRSEDKEFLEKYFPDKFIFEESPDDSEYICNIKEVVNLEGHKFHRLRNMCNSLMNNYGLTVEPLNDDNISEAKEIVAIWGKDKNKRTVLNTIGNEVDCFILDNYKELDISGIILRVGDKGRAVIGGYRLTDDTFDPAICKAIGDIKYIGYVVFVEMMKYVENDYTYMNLEEDLGLYGLKLLKRGMRPCRMNYLWQAKYVG